MANLGLFDLGELEENVPRRLIVTSIDNENSNIAVFGATLPFRVVAIT